MFLPSVCWSRHYSNVSKKASVCDNFLIVFWLRALILRSMFNTSRPRKNGSHFADDSSKSIFLVTISLMFVPKDPINNTLALLHIMAWRRAGDKPLSELMVVKLTMHMCVTRSQWVNSILYTAPCYRPSMAIANAVGNIQCWIVCGVVVRCAGLIWSQQDFEWWWSVPLSSASLY